MLPLYPLYVQLMMTIFSSWDM